MATKMKSLAQGLVSQNVLQQRPVRLSFLRREDDSLSMLKERKKSSRTLLKQQEESMLFRRSTDFDLLKNLNDVELIDVIKNQNREAYQELFSRYQKKLFSYIYHLVGNRDETEDILQNVFAKTYRNIGYFDVTRKFSSWIYRIAHNEAVNYLKRRSKRYTVSWEEILTSKDKLDSASGEELPGDRLEHQEIAAEIDLALKKIPEKYQEVLKMRYFKEYSYEEMGKILHKPVNTVGTLINRAKRKLLESVKGNNARR